MKITGQDLRKYIAEMIGTMVLVVCGCGVAQVTGCEGNAGIIATALAFGLTIVAMAYSIGNISGCHINPAVSLSMLVSKKMSVKDFIFYVIFQILGATLGCVILLALFGTDCGFGANQVQPAIVDLAGDVGSLFVGFLAEIILTFVFVMAIIGVTSKQESAGKAGVVIGFTLILVHLLGIRITGTSVNPARSLMPALFAMIKGNFEPIKQIWIFIIGPLFGATLAAVCYEWLSFVKAKKAETPAVEAEEAPAEEEKAE